MTAEDFAQACKAERDLRFALYLDPNSGTEVANLCRRASLTPEQSVHVQAALGCALTDTFYAMLLALDGCASLGGSQQPYILKDEFGNIVSSGDGSLELAAWEAFHSL